MAKRNRKRSKSRKKNKPNIPQQTLERARAGMEDEGALASEVDEIVEEIEEEADHELTDEERAVAAAQAIQRMRNERYERREARKSRSRKSTPEATPDMVAEALANPSKEVSREELKTQYNYVLMDLRNMGILAAALFMILIGLGLWQTL
ncbi:MAG: hypothetical protein AAF787_05125 [Chloroflexota bacterium]